MDAVRTLSATSTSFTAAHIALAERMICIKAAIVQNHAILVPIQSQLSLPPISPSVPAQASSVHHLTAPAASTQLEPPTASLDLLAAIVADAPLAAPQPALAEDDLPPTAHH